MRAERKLRLEGGNGVGPARQSEQRKQTRHPNGGRERDELVDDLVLESDEPKPGQESRHVVYCIGCDKRAVGRNPTRIGDHGSDCQVCMRIVLFLSCVSTDDENIAGGYQAFPIALHQALQ